MRPAKLYLYASTFAAIACMALGAHAQPVAPEAGAMPVSAAASAVAPQRAPTIAAVQAVSVGKQDTSSDAKSIAGTFRELEALQRETAIAEMRKKLNDLKPAPLTAVPIATPASPSAAIIEMAPKRKKQGETKPGQVTITPPPMVFKAVEHVAPPTAKLVNLFVVGGRARADVMDGTRVFTIKEGDKLGRWTVASITNAGVTVERHYTESQPAPGLTPPPSSEARPSIAQAFAGAYGLVNSAYPTYIEIEKVETKTLESATPSDIAVGMSGAKGQGATSVGAASLPPLPRVDKPDSTSLTAVPPLPPALLSGPAPMVAAMPIVSAPANVQNAASLR